MTAATSGAIERDLARALPHLKTSVDDADRVAYARDLWPRHHLAVRAGNVAAHRPAVIAWPENTRDVRDLVAWANRSGTALVPFGAGSGVCAGVLPKDDVVVVDMKRMARVRSIDEGAPSIDVEAGHMGLTLEETLNARGFTLGHFPSSIGISTVGGWIAARSAGQCSGYYGKIEDMVASIECVTGAGNVVTLAHRTHGPNLVPLVIGSEGTLAIVTAATLRLHPKPARAFAAWSLASIEEGTDAMRELFQSGVRPAVARLYDPFDALLAKQTAETKSKSKSTTKQASQRGSSDLASAAIRALLNRPRAINALVDAALGEVLLLVVIEAATARDAAEAEEHARDVLLAKTRAKYIGEGPARTWFAHRYAVSYRQAPIFAAGAWVDTMEVAAPWSKLYALYTEVKHALAPHAFVMAHFSHAYPDGCCIYFSFAGSGDEEHYDRAWRSALDAVVSVGGTIAHHHGVGRSKAPRLRAELGIGVDVVRAIQRAFDPRGVLNPGNLVPPPSPDPWGSP